MYCVATALKQGRARDALLFILPDIKTAGRFLPALTSHLAEVQGLSPFRAET